MDSQSILLEQTPQPVFYSPSLIASSILITFRSFHTMGKNTKRVKEFIESIPDSKLTGFASSGGLIFKDTDFRLDMQGVSRIAVATMGISHRY